MFIKGYGFLSFGKNMGKNIGKNVSKSLNSKYSPGMLSIHQKCLDHVNQSPTDPIKTSSKRVIQKTAKAICDSIDSKMANNVTNVSKNSETVTNEHVIKKYLKKDMYLQKKGKKLLMNELMCGYFCIWFIDFMFKGKSLLDYTNLFSPNDYGKNDKIILRHFQ